MSAGDPRDFDAPDGSDSEQDEALEAEQLGGEGGLSRSVQNGDTRLRV